VTSVDHGPRPDPPSEGSLPPAPPRGLSERTRRWYQAAIAALLVGIYLACWLTYVRLHLPPLRYEQLPPGAVATKLGGDFTLVSLTWSNELVDTDGERHSPPADAVWVVARLDVTRHTVDQYWNCVVTLVGDNGRSWEKPFGLGYSRPFDSCVPDDAALGQTYPIEIDFQVPASDVDRLLGVAVPQNNSSRDPLLTPPR
jgi:hypothetical protein